ncbi:MAG: hypothetical protein GEV06_23870 [Luteitalea sp.]|nr:hypothetical protein [Luteitalea sp.]
MSNLSFRVVGVWVGCWLLASLAASASGSDPGNLRLGDPSRRDQTVELGAGMLVDTASGKAISLDDLAAHLDDTRLLLVGEEHDSVASHDLQRRVIEALVGRGRRVLIGLEMLPRSSQPALDRWTRGDLEEEALPEAVDWRKHWGMSWRYYRELFLLAREHALPLVALNVPREVISAVRARGVTGLSPEEAAQVPTIHDPANADHLALFRAFMGDDAAAHGPTSPEDWTAMLRAQAAWDAVMARRAVDALDEEADTNAIMAVLAGTGHVAYGLGIERQARQWFDGPIASILPASIAEGADRQTVRASYASFLQGVPEEPARGQAPPKPDSRGQPLTVMSFNIRYGTAEDGPDRWEARRALLFEVLRSERPDIVGVQEALHFQLQEILEALPQFAMVGVGRDDGKREGEYSAILYRRDRFTAEASDTFWLSDTPDVPGSTSWGNTIPRICTWARFADQSGATFYAYNVHLDHRSQPSREQSTALLAEQIRSRTPPAPVVVTGDFNAAEDNPAVETLRELPDGGVFLVDTFRVRHRTEPTAGTFNGFELGNTGGDKIDYVFAEPTTEVLEATIGRTSRDGRYPSDHFPVVARIRLAK